MLAIAILVLSRLSFCLASLLSALCINSTFLQEICLNNCEYIIYRKRTRFASTKLDLYRSRRQSRLTCLARHYSTTLLESMIFHFVFITCTCSSVVSSSRLVTRAHLYLQNIFFSLTSMQKTLRKEGTLP